MRYWQIAFGGSLLLSIIFSVGLVVVSCQSKIKPFIVETQQGQPYAIHTGTRISLSDERLINFALNQFIINSRTVLPDNAAQKQLTQKVYAYSADQTIGYLHDYYQANNPFEKIAEYTVDVSIINAMPLTQNTWQITWDETKRNLLDHSALSQTRWLANITFAFAEPNEKFLNDNPFGLYVTHLNWSQNQKGKAP
jgi:type IV secretory pathway TrbF-like protein